MREDEVQEAYDRYKEKYRGRGCLFCHMGPENEKIGSSYFWDIYFNLFPYKIMKPGQLVLKSRIHLSNNGHVKWYKTPIYWISLLELWYMRRYIYKNYIFMHNGAEQESISHLHFHLVKFKDNL